MDGQLTAAQAGALLLGLRAKGETAAEMQSAVQNALERACLIPGVEGDYADVVGTGGDGKHSFNCSTTTALILAGMGYRIIKHGNRAASSSSGAADALESLGYSLDLDPDGIRESLKMHNFAFAFAPHFHPSFKHMGYDALTVFGSATACLVQGELVQDLVIDPKDWGFTEPPASPDELRVETREEAAAALRALLAGQGSRAMADMVAFNVALGIRLFEPDRSASECGARAREAVASGVGMRVVQGWQS